MLERTIRSLRITLDLASAMSAAYEGLELARRLDDQPALARFECWVSMAERSTGNAEESARLATSAVDRGRKYDDPVAVTAGAQLLLTLPDELRPTLDPPLPALEELLEQCERIEQPFIGMTVLAALAHESSTRGDHAAAAHWLWRLLMIGANRQRTEPMATLAGIAQLFSVALAAGERRRRRTSAREHPPLELFLPYCIGPQAAARLPARRGRPRRLGPRGAPPTAGPGGRPPAWARPTAGPEARSAPGRPPAPGVAAAGGDVGADTARA